MEAETMLLLHPLKDIPRNNQQALAWCPWQPECPQPPMISNTGSLTLPDDPSMLLAVSWGSKVWHR
ncbi:unnamed protein product [Echinostoma caproni]|uniref:Alternative protein n=1 Tax=Echinostoma caproni TaxID=27848 RepID=A0A183AMH6_9TREM|nr:unnamed protein product [Echinostoma caproni]